jgi:hypothetical protein
MERKSRRPIRLKSEKLERAPKPKRIVTANLGAIIYY